MYVCVYVYYYELTHVYANVILVSPLFPQRGLNFTHSDQGAEVFHLCADFRHVQAAHVVDVLAQPSRLQEKGQVLSVKSQHPTNSYC